MAATPRVRDHLVRALEAELVGPYSLQDQSEEVLPEAPSRWYLTGFLAPVEDEDARDDDDQDDPTAGGEDANELQPAEPQPHQHRRHQFSMGMTLLVPADVLSLEATVRYANYEPVKDAVDHGDGRNRRRWHRRPIAPRVVHVPLTGLPGAHAVEPGGAVDNGLVVECRVAPIPASSADSGVRAVALFVVNRRKAVTTPGERERAYAFQVSLTVQCPAGLVPWPQSTEGRSEWDDRVAQLQYRDHHRFCSGLNVATTVEPAIDGKTTTARTCWLPQHELGRVVHSSDEQAPGLELGMEALARLQRPADIDRALSPLTTAYRTWLGAQSQLAVGPMQGGTRDALVKAGRDMLGRIATGIELLKSEGDVRQAFCWANQAMHDQALRRVRPKAGPGAETATSAPRWRMFQLAFLLANLSSCNDSKHPDRLSVDLIFFPTGGGKTEAYLGVMAVVVLLRRLRGQSRPDGGLGVAILLRYTLRLLTIDQLARATTLFCALERIRQNEPNRLGPERLTLGLWVGSSATPNTVEGMEKRINAFKESTGTSAGLGPLPICPWCHNPFSKTSFSTKTKPFFCVRTFCPNKDCEFSANQNALGLPISFVDEHLYDEPPALLLSTVDKLAMLPWRGASAKLFGQARARQNEQIVGFDQPEMKGERKLTDGLAPPELIVQDELHLIGGPLGTMVGLYESAIGLVCQRPFDGQSSQPKILASSATARRAEQQVKSLFGRNRMTVFPPPGPSVEDSFFSRVIPPAHDHPGRLYLGVAASGRAFKNVLIRTYVTLLAAAQHQHQRHTAPAHLAPSDGYMTLVGYFNSLRELGGMRRLVEDDVESRLRHHQDRHPDGLSEALWSAHRQRGARVLRELTSREHIDTITETRSQLSTPFPLATAAGDRPKAAAAAVPTSEQAIDVLLASNMISVGIDIGRLGLMVVAGQPKTASEYIQATSRVGRNDKWPGLVVTCFNLHKARDRSHYEYFQSFHAAFYRHVESSSLTPLSEPALRRGLMGVWFLALRILIPSMASNQGATAAVDFRKQLDDIGEKLVKEASLRLNSIDPSIYIEERTENTIRIRIRAELDRWLKAAANPHRKLPLLFSSFEAKSRSSRTGKKKAEQHFLLQEFEKYSKNDVASDAGSDLNDLHQQNEDLQATTLPTFSLPTSMRETESMVHLWVRP